MSPKREVLPAWKRVEPERVNATNRRLGNAIAALHDRYGRESIEGSGFSVELVYDALVRPGHYWQRHVRTSRSGKETRCFSPSPDLRALQMWLAKLLIPGFGETLFPGTAYGKGCSIIDNAKFHRRGRSCIRLDLKGAFPSITTNQIGAMLVRPPWSTKHCDDPTCTACETLATPMNADLAWVASRLFTRSGRLEQGSPIAPHLFNRMMERFDRDVCAATGTPIMPTTALYSDFVYTRYADDIVVSCVGDELPSEIEPAVRAVIAMYNLRVNEYKVERTHGGVVSVPGILIRNGRMRPNGRYIAQLIASWKTLGSKQQYGHRMYLAAFGKGVRLKVFFDRVPIFARRKHYPRRLS